MGVAAYNRGSRAIRESIEREYYERTHKVTVVGPAFVEKKPEDPLPEGRLRSSYAPTPGGSDTAIFLDYENRWYLISSHFQILKRTRSLDKAIRIFERVEMFGFCALEML